jgi:hypothetical protein
VDFDVTDVLLIKYFAFVRRWEKSWSQIGQCVSVFIDAENAHVSVKRDLLHKPIGRLI